MNNKEINELAKIFMFQIKDEELDETKETLNEYFELIKRMDVIDTEGVEAMVYPFENNYGVLREDDTFGLLSTKEVLSNAPEVIDEQVAVPKVVK